MLIEIILLYKTNKLSVMKQVALLSVVFAIIISGFGQTLCTTPVSNTFFQREYGTINSTINANAKLTYAINMASNNCLSSSQIKQITLLFYADQDKLEFAKAAYRNAVDKENFYDVYDAFAYFSSVFRLHDYVTLQRGQNTNFTTTTTTITTYDYPNYIYPEFTNYFGVTGCNYPMDEGTFYKTYQSMKFSKITESAKSINIKDFINMNCLSTAQIMKLTSVLSMESFRLEVLKAAYLKAYDRANFGYADQLLTTNTYKVDFNNYINGYSSNTINSNNNTVVSSNCTVTMNDMNDIKSSINNASFDNTKITLAKQVLSAKKCFMVSQIKEILQLFSFESSKLEVAKYAYDFCSDKSNYYQVNDVFSFSSSKDDLTKYVQGRQ